MAVVRASPARRISFEDGSQHGGTVLRKIRIAVIRVVEQEEFHIRYLKAVKYTPRIGCCRIGIRPETTRGKSA